MRTTLETIRERVRQETHLLPAPDDLLVAIAKSLSHHRDEWLDINEVRFELVTVIDKWRYSPGEGQDVASGIAGWPQRLVSARSPLSFRRTATDRPVDLPDSSVFFRPFVNRPGGEDETIDWSGTPEGFMVLEGDLVLLPVPDTAGWFVSGHGLIDLGTPQGRYVGSTWTWYDSVTGQRVDDDWTTPFFDDPLLQDMVVMRAAFELAQSDGDTEMQNNWARAWQEKFRRVKQVKAAQVVGGGSQQRQRW